MPNDERIQASLDERVPSAKFDALMKACNEFERQDLHGPLSYILNLNVRWLSRNLEPFVKRGRYVLAANVMLYGSKNNLAKEYLLKARAQTKPGSLRRRRLTIVINNLPVVARIAQRFWELEGKYSMGLQDVAPAYRRSMRAWKANIFNRILVAVDGSNNARKAGIVAVRLAKRNASELIVTTVAPPPRYVSPTRSDLEYLLSDYDATMSKESEKRVSDIVGMAKSHGVDASGYVRKSSSVVRSITEFGEQLGVDLIVLGTRGQSGIETRLLGSVSKGVVSHAPCSVLVVR
jgi:nucleotide-binding universal stress UspA family protein